MTLAKGLALIRISIRRTALVLGSFALTNCAEGGSPNSPSPQPTPQPIQTAGPQTLARVGTIWTYGVSVSLQGSNGSVPSTGVIKVAYDGIQTYRGSSYYTSETVGGVVPTDLQNYYVINDGGFAEQVGTDLLAPIAPRCFAPKRETILSAPANFSAAQNISGAATMYQCSLPNGSEAWSLYVIDEGSAVRTVPAGTFAVRVSKGVWKLGAEERDYTQYTFGVDVIERDTVESENGAVRGSYETVLHQAQQPSPSPDRR